MIVLKATQDRFLAILESVAEIVERRHTLPILANVLIRRKAGMVEPFEQIDPLDQYDPNKTARAIVQVFSPARNVLRTAGRGSNVCLSLGLSPSSGWSMASSLRRNGFFCAGKANLRNAP